MKTLLVAGPSMAAAFDPPWNTVVAIVLGVLAVAYVVLVVTAIVTILRELSGERRILWVVVVVLLPILGSIVWLAWGRRRSDQGMTSVE